VGEGRCELVPSPIRKDTGMSHLRILSLRIGVTAALVLAALPAAGW
jgi:hypothetical protein